MSSVQTAIAHKCPTQFLETTKGKYAYRRFGKGPSLPLLCLQHFTEHSTIGILRSPTRLHQSEKSSCRKRGLGTFQRKVPETVAGMAEHALAFWTVWG